MVSAALVGGPPGPVPAAPGELVAALAPDVGSGPAIGAGVSGAGAGLEFVGAEAAPLVGSAVAAPEVGAVATIIAAEPDHACIAARVREFARPFALCSDDSAGEPSSRAVVADPTFIGAA
ncbi:hypothetical protein [Nannocystis bainbridge]|uniref:Uncharacterized protein n=1 Tax=Nannocystis bainbridge TaxID=2995303 RepID=A0ABT5E9N6_9BACT|nr:hypothetical protein [Nannocystis bainbridge]MDC0722572.1 hypothetical protein [Nannocystis bainbridge]